MRGRIVDDTTFRRLIRARDFLAAGYTGCLRLEDAARQACLSPFHFQRLFSRVFGESPHDFVARLRMENALRLLEDGEMPVTDVCMEIGYVSLGSFSARFAARMGQSPSRYRRNSRRWIAPVHGWPVFRIPGCFWLPGTEESQV